MDSFLLSVVFGASFSVNWINDFCLFSVDSVIGLSVDFAGDCNVSLLLANESKVVTEALFGVLTVTVLPVTVLGLFASVTLELLESVISWVLADFNKASTVGCLLSELLEEEVDGVVLEPGIGVF